ncbi:MAG: bifunctional DNA-formamidopyrimidine glycosylase/DNA-(apurinic or apyrimidinic site) lyase [Fimbriimonadaceae bacterium]|nr:bifunctional DNA-formamidopyrimidine glycosylase/DNA-(apurinic or apyrimidinic site) lyase [Fimbriimonadaceae bacterium]
MPELPEVETVRRGLQAAAVGRTIVGLRWHHAKPLRPSPAAFERLVGRTAVATSRVGKHLFLHFDGDLSLAMHLRMTGQLRLQGAAEPLLPHTHLELPLDDGRILRWRDVRRFGWLEVLPTAAVPAMPCLQALGPDALQIDAATFVAGLRARRQMLKALLLSQDLLCGLGNIDADEARWGARLHPQQRGDQLGPRQARRLYEAIQAVLAAAIAAQGSSIDGEYVALDGNRGSFQQQHAVYGRWRQPAPCCGGPVARLTVASRSTHFCPRCQRRRGGGGRQTGPAGVD